MIIKKVYKGTTPFIKGYKGTTVIFEEGGGLPPEYQQVEWIKSTSNDFRTNYIDTGLYCDEYTVVEMECMVNSTSFRDYGRLFGDSSGSGAWGFEVLGMDSNASMTYRYDAMGDYGYGLSNDTRYKITLGDYELYIDDNLINTWSGQYDGSSYTLKIFSSNEDRDGAYTLYSFKVYQNGVLVRDYVPCYIKATNEVGLYDLVTQEFYHNCGSVPFVAGGDV